MGNLSTQTDSSAWGSDPTGNATTTGWQPHLTTHFTYYPNLDGVYLTALLARQWVTATGGAMLSETLNLYDNHTIWSTPPTVGILTGVRTWVGGANYRQVDYGYDDESGNWGNRTSVTAYKNYATAAANPTSTDAVTQQTTFDPTYHIYPTIQKNALNQETDIAYDYTLGLPTSQTDVNGVTSYVQYDDFGRLTKVVKPGDVPTPPADIFSAPTLKISYHDYTPGTPTGDPFHIDLELKVDGSHTYLLRHSYDGLGREILTETGHGSFTSFTPDTIVKQQSYYQDGQSATKKSAPYAPGGGEFYTTTLSDILGRPVTITAPDNSSTHPDKT